MRRFFAVLACLPAVAQAGDEIYTSVDPDGTVRYSNVAPGKVRGSVYRVRGDITRVSAPLEFRPRADSSAYDPFIQGACDLYKIPPALVRAIISVESNFDPQAVSRKGAQGLMQLMPATADEMFVDQAFDPEQNIYGGVRYLRVLTNMFEGDMIRIVAAYNAGPEQVKRAGGVPELAETQDYVRRVIRLYFAYKN